jgi:uncharacterized membrane protein
VLASEIALPLAGRLDTYPRDFTLSDCMSFDPNIPPEDPLGTPPPPPPLEVPFERPGVTPGTGLPRNIAAALACIFLLIGGIAFYILDRRDRYVRFYALQSIVLSTVFCVIGLALKISGGILGFIPWVGPHLFHPFFDLLSGLTFIVFLVLWIPLIWNAYRGKTHEMPYLWRTAKRHIPGALL